MKNTHARNQGTILIFALWTLTLLVAFAVYISAGVRQRMILVQRLESRSKLSACAVSAIRKGIMALDQAHLSSAAACSAPTKAKLMNNENDFSAIALSGAQAGLGYDIFDKSFRQSKKQYGMIGEAAKININFADQRTLTRLFQAVLGWSAEKAEKLALAIVDWRTSGESTLKGFFSEDYYKNLAHPYASKNAPFEILNEVLLVEGMDAGTFERVRHFVTPYGQGGVDINAAPFPVLYALGFAPEVAQEILTIRAGADGLEATDDDRVFSSLDEFALLLGRSSAVTDTEANFMQKLGQEGKIGIGSDLYALEAVARTDNEKQQMTIRCIYNAATGKIVYWQET